MLIAYLLMITANLVVWSLCRKNNTIWRLRRVITPTGRIALQLTRFYQPPERGRPVPYLGPPEP